MAEISPLKQDLYEEDFRAGAAATEDTMNKVGSSVNFWNNRYEGVRPWVISGPYSITPVPDNGIDGYIACPYDMEIFGVFIGALTAGSSGTSEIDVVKYPVVGSPATIFTTRPAIPSTSGSDAFIQVETLPSYSVIRQAAGTTAPVLASTELTKGDVLKLNWISKQTGGEGLTVALFIRPRA